MAQYIDKSALLEEIEKLVDKGKYHDEYDYAYRDGNNGALYALKNKLDTLEVKEVQGEAVSEDLEEAIDTYLKSYWGGEKEKQEWPFLKKMAIYFAKWQEEQFEKNRLKHCNSITNKQAELEQGFIDQHIDKYQRIPTFLDAIEYGMRLKEQQMMAKAVDGVITFDYYGDDDKTYGCIAHDSFCLEDFGLKDTDKVKMILIKE